MSTPTWWPVLIQQTADADLSPPTSTPTQTGSPGVKAGVSFDGLPGSGWEPVAGAFDPLVGVEAAERDLGNGLALFGEVAGGDPRRRVHPLDGLDVVDRGVVGQRPFEHPQVGAAGVGEPAPPHDLRLCEGAGPEPSERAVGALAGGRDHDQLRPRRLHHPGAQRGVDGVVGVRVELVDQHEGAAEAVELGGVGGEHHPHEPGEHRRPVGVGAPAQLEVADHDVRVFEPQGEPDGRLEQDRACCRDAAATYTSASGLVARWCKANAAINVVLPEPRGISTASSRSRPAAAFAIFVWNGSR